MPRRRNHRGIVVLAAFVALGAWQGPGKVAHVAGTVVHTVVSALPGVSSGTMSESQIETLWESVGGPSGAAQNMALIANAESGDVVNIVQQGQPAATTGWGLWQITPTSGISQDGQFGDLLVAANNARAALFLYNRSGYAPWSSDPVGKSLCGC
jgi:hypothetical protein